MNKNKLGVILALPYFDRVSGLIGYNNAVYELGRVRRVAHTERLSTSFSWVLTPQGMGFWAALSRGDAPNMYKGWKIN